MTHIVVIDDDDLLRGLLKDEPERDGYRVTVAADGLEGLNRIKADPPDLVITDIFMPEKEGIEVVRELRAAWPGIGIIAISGSRPDDGVDFLKVAAHLGADRALHKPFRLDEIRAAVEGLLGGGGRMAK